MTERGCRSAATKDTMASVISLCFPPSVDFHSLAVPDAVLRKVPAEPGKAVNKDFYE